MMQGGEIFVPKIPSMKIMDLAKAVAPESERKIIGIRPGEKLHETMVPQDDARKTLEYDDFFLIQPEFRGWGSGNWKGGRKLPDGFTYSSDTNTWWLTVEEIREMIGIKIQENAKLQREELEVGAHAN
jgi:UDP-N-acetylglucosamine 4,6-dehydratase